MRRKLYEIFRIVMTFPMLVSVASAQQLNPQQVKVITDAANSICNTVKDAKGKKSEVQLQGDVKAQLSGLLGKVADLGGSATGRLSQAEFEGLSQDATATAMEGDRDCRQRVFHKMFDKLSATRQDSKAEYANGMRRDDLRTVRLYIEQVQSVSTLLQSHKVSGCGENERLRVTDEMLVDAQDLRVTNSGYSICDGNEIIDSEFSDICSANISQLDEILDIYRKPESVRVRVNCMIGKCVKCRTKKNWLGGLNLESEEEFLEVYSGDLKYATRHMPKLTAFARALSRIISGGSDDAFCKARPSYC